MKETGSLNYKLKHIGTVYVNMYLVATRNTYVKVPNIGVANTNTPDERLVVKPSVLTVFFPTFPFFTAAKMSDEEEDYMSDAFLSKM